MPYLARGVLLTATKHPQISPLSFVTDKSTDSNELALALVSSELALALVPSELALALVS